jgi:hypothetical protein
VLNFCEHSAECSGSVNMRNFWLAEQLAEFHQQRLHSIELLCNDVNDGHILKECSSYCLQ